MADRPTQPRCADCNHAKSFHPKSGRCVAFGCSCSRWRKVASKVAGAAKKKAPA